MDITKLGCHIRLIHVFTETLLNPRQTSPVLILKWCRLRFLIYSLVWPCAHTQSSMTLQSAKSKCHFSCRLQDVRGPPLICSVSPWMFANHCFEASLCLTAGQWDVLFCIQDTLASCLCQRRFHYLTGDDPESLAMGPMATWHTERFTR